MGGSSTAFKKRIETIDVLRGFALAGILYTHMVIWYTGAALPPDVYSKYDSTADGIAMAVFGGLTFGKFFSVFSFLFGLSFYLYFLNNKPGDGHIRTYIWRLCLLFLIGLVHHAIWRGDILAIYAVLGVLLLVLRNLPSKLLLFISFLLIINLPTHVYDIFITEIPNAEADLPMAEGAKRYYDLVKNAGFVTVLKENWSSWPAKIQYQLESGRLLMTFGYFLLGFYAGRANLFTSLDKYILKFKRWNKAMERAVIFLLMMGLLMYLNDYVTIPKIKIVPKYKWLAGFLFSIYNTCVTVFYITGITLLMRNPTFSPVIKPLATMGRMALTNYLLQTFFGLLLFYDFGLGLFDRTSPAVNVLLAVVVFYLQLKFSKWWLKHYEQGPVEWLWKNLTSFKFFPIKKQTSESREVKIP